MTTEIRVMLAGEAAPGVELCFRLVLEPARPVVIDAEGELWSLADRRRVA